jgi:capsular exopolysaccharide synthesis family protein
MERLRDNLSVRPRNRTEIIDVTFSCRNPKDAKLVVDTVLDQYIKYVREMSNATEDQLYRQLVEQYKSLESEIQGREKIVAELRRSLGAEIPQDLISAKRSHLDETQVRLDELQQSLAVLEWEREKQNLVANKKIHLDQTQFRLGKIQQNIAMLDWEREKLMEYIEQAESSDGNDTSVAFLDDTDSQSKYFGDAEWRKLDVEVKTLRHQIENSLYTSKHPNMIQARKDLEFKEELLRQRELQLDQQMSMDGEGGLYAAGMEGLSYEEKLKSLDYQRERVKHEEELLVAEFGKEQAEFDAFFKNVQLLQEESDELQHKRDLFSAIRQRLDQKNVERNVPGSIDVLMWAFVPSKPHNDRRIVYTAMVLIFGLGLGCGIALLRASKHQAVYSVKDMSLPMQVPFLGHIPLIRLRKPFGGTLREEIEHNQFLLIESIRVMRTTLLSRLDEQGSATVLITSSTAGTGKSSFTKILGKCMAKAGKRVLMIDVDFHKMTLSKWFELVDKPGFIDGLHTRAVDNRHIYQTDIPGLSVMPSGVRDDNNRIVYEEIANGAFEAYIGELRKENTIILLDSSPILPIADAVIMSSQVDGTIMVERELVSRRGSVENAISRLGSAGGHLLGVVFVGSSGYEKYGYGYDSSYYGYGYTYSATS